MRISLPVRPILALVSAGALSVAFGFSGPAQAKGFKFRSHSHSHASHAEPTGSKAAGREPVSSSRGSSHVYISVGNRSSGQQDPRRDAAKPRSAAAIAADARRAQAVLAAERAEVASEQAVTPVSVVGPTKDYGNGVVCIAGC